MWVQSVQTVGFDNKNCFLLMSRSYLEQFIHNLYTVAYRWTEFVAYYYCFKYLQHSVDRRGFKA